jgi:hypothetical protein
VSDVDAPQFVADIYGALVRGMAPDRALEKATLDARRRAGEAQDGLAHPYHWAAWVMSGSLSAISRPLSRFVVVQPTTRVEVAVGPPEPLSVVDGLERTIYTTAGVHGGVEVFGRGQRIVVTLLNRSADPVQLTEVALILVNRRARPAPELRYDKVTLGIPATRGPAPVAERTVRWTDDDQAGARKIVFDGPAPQVVGRWRTTLDVEAAAPGLWEYTVEVAVRDLNGNVVVVPCATHLAVLLRGR